MAPSAFPQMYKYRKEAFDQFIQIAHNAAHKYRKEQGDAERLAQVNMLMKSVRHFKKKHESLKHDLPELQERLRLQAEVNRIERKRELAAGAKR